MPLMVNYQLTSFLIRRKTISLKESCYKRFQVFALTSLIILFFSTSKSKDLKRISKIASDVVLALKFPWT